MGACVYNQQFKLHTYCHNEKERAMIERRFANGKGKRWSRWWKSTVASLLKRHVPKETVYRDDDATIILIIITSYYYYDYRLLCIRG